MGLLRTPANKKTISKGLGWNTLRCLTRIASAVSLVLVSWVLLYGGHISSSNARIAPIPRLSDNVSIQAAGRGNPWINMTDGHDLLTSYEGSDDLVRLMSQDGARPLSLATADFDEDGMPDLIAGYEGMQRGIIALHRGNVDSVYPNTAAAKKRKADGTFSDVPFLLPARVFEAAVRPEFIAAGDFDADGHEDLVIASRGDDSIYLLPGDGRGGFKSVEAMHLSGGVTALTTGDINRADGLPDLVVAVSGTSSPELVVFEGPQGAFKSEPETIALPDDATALEVGYLSDGPQADIVVGAGRELLVVHGRDRRLFLGERDRQNVPAALITRRDFASRITSLAIGDFTGDLKLDVALATEDGTVRIVSGLRASGERLLSGGESFDWTVETLGVNQKTGNAKLICARVSALSHETLIMTDPANRRLQVWMDDDERRNRQDPTLKSAIGTRAEPVSFDLDGEPVSLLPMRLNMDGLSDLVILRSGHSFTTLVRTLANPIPVCNPGDCVNCGSLRDAITAANGTGGGNMIEFQSGTFNQVTTITLDPQLGALPAITKALTIDGAEAASVSCGSQALEAGPADFGPQALTAIQLTTNNGLATAINVQTGGCVVRNFVINRFQNGIQVANSRGSFVEGNLVGTDPSGTQTRPNTARGLLINNAGDNTIGGTVNAASNRITGNALGVEINGPNATDNRVRLNAIGVNANNIAVGNNNGNGVTITNGASRNAIGGNISNTGNVIAGNIDGVAILSGSANVVQRNTFDFNNGNGATINSPGNTIGGTPQGISVSNGFFRGGKNGVELTGAGSTNNLVQGNFIGINFDNSGNALDRHNAQHGVAITNNASGNFVGGSSDVNLGNLIALNLGDGVSVISGTGNRILFNQITSNSGLGIDLGDDGRDTNDDKDGDSGPNNKQNFPVLVAASLTPVSPDIARFRPEATITIRVSLNSTPNQNFDIDFYHCTNPCGGSGDQFSGCIPRPLGIRTVTTDADGNVTQDFSFDLGTGVNSGFINAKATNKSTGDTSEFSTCAQIGACSFSANPPTRTVGANSGSDSFGITTLNGCAWTATSNAPWLTTSSAGNGNGTVNYTFSQNTTGSDRTGTISVGNATHIVTQTTTPAGPLISNACRGEGKKLLINGSGFQEGAKVFLNGEQEKTSFVSETQVIAKKAGKRAATGDTLSVRNPDSTQSPVFPYTKNSCFVQ